MGHILENIVYLELVRPGYEVHVGKVHQAEIGFIATTAEDTLHYQVSQTVMDKEILMRELASLEAIRDNNPKLLLTLDYAPPTSYNDIKQLNVIDWLLT